MIVARVWTGVGF